MSPDPNEAGGRLNIGPYRTLCGKLQFRAVAPALRLRARKNLERWPLCRLPTLVEKTRFPSLNSPEKNSLIWLLGNLAGSHLGTGRTPKQEGQQKASEKASNMGNVSDPSHISGSVGVRNCSNATEEL